MRRVLLIVTLAALIGDFVVGAVASRFSAADKDAAKSAIQNTTSVDGLRVHLAHRGEERFSGVGGAALIVAFAD
jgi:FlaG/FlaF family flagellin (archaellin)